MRTTPIPATFFEASKRGDLSKTPRGSDQMYSQQGPTAFTMGAIQAGQAESFRNDKLALRSARSGKA